MSKDAPLNFTFVDAELGFCYFPILLDVAQRKYNDSGLITYKELVEEAKRRHPENETVRGAIPVSTGRRLYFIRKFTDAHQLPDLTSLVINQGTGQPGEGMPGNIEEIRKQIAKFNWEEVNLEFNLYTEQQKKDLTPKKRRKREAAVKLMSDYYKENKNMYPPNITSYREEIIELLMEGEEPKEAFDAVL